MLHLYILYLLFDNSLISTIIKNLFLSKKICDVFVIFNKYYIYINIIAIVVEEPMVEGRSYQLYEHYNRWVHVLRENM